MQNSGAELLLVRVLGEKFIATLQCFVRNLLMHQNGKVCVFFIKMLHSINPICRKDTGGDPGTQLRKLSPLSVDPSCLLPQSSLSPALIPHLSPPLEKKPCSSLTTPQRGAKGVWRPLWDFPQGLTKSCNFLKRLLGAVGPLQGLYEVCLTGWRNFLSVHFHKLRFWLMLAFFKGFFVKRQLVSASRMFWNVLPQEGRWYHGGRMVGSFSPFNRKWECPSLKRTGDFYSLQPFWRWH